MNKYIPNFKIWRGLPAQLFILVILPFAVLALAATLMSVGLHQNAMRRMVAERDLWAVQTAATFLESKLKTEQDVANVLNLQYGAGTSLKSFVTDHNLSSKQLAIFSDQGSLFAFSGDKDRFLQLQNYTFTPGIIQTVVIDDKKELIFSSRSSTNFLFVNAVELEPMIRDVIGSGFKSGGDSSALLMSADRSVLLRIGNQSWDGDPSQHPGVTDALQGRSGFTYMSTSTMEHVVAFSPVLLPGWALVIEEPWEMVDTPYLRLTQFAPLILIPVLIFTLVALWFGTTQVVLPLQKLEKLAAELAWGDFSAIERQAGGVQEIKQLQKEMIHMAQKVQDAQSGLRSYIGAITRGQEDERRRLARELHDETLQALIALHQRVQLAQLKANNLDMQRSLSDLEDLSNKSIVELRRLTRALRPIYLEDFGLVTALEMLAKENTKPEFEVIFSPPVLGRRLDPAQELTLFRIAQEALNNSDRHSGANRVIISLEFFPVSVKLEIEDNGKGFTPPSSPAEFAPSGHYGLMGMHERVELIGGKLSIISSGNGTKIIVQIPES